MSRSTQDDSVRDREFGYPIRLASSFEEVLARGASRSTLDVSAFSEFVRRSACTLLQARGGAGKTHTARRVCDELRERGLWTVVIPAIALVGDEPLASWSPGQWAESSDGDNGAGLEDATGAGLIVIDGLNEVDRPTGERILDAVGPLTASNPQVSVLITDRLVRRSAASPYWKYATLGPVPDEVIRDVSGAEPTEALSIPFYLERHSSGSAAHDILAESIGRFVDGDALAALAKASYESYRIHLRRTLDVALVDSAVGPAVWESMLDANVVVPIKVSVGDGPPTTDFHFEHHLLHDFLAAGHLASDEDLWNSDGFDVVTLKASSFDALGLALAQVRTEDLVDELIQRVYDWNFYAAAYMLEEDRGADARVSDAVRLALLGALAEKRFDIVRPTVVRVEDALRVQQSALTDTLLRAADREQVVTALLDHRPDSPPAWFMSWLEHFSRPNGARVSSDEAEAITSDQPLLGWGVANALRRSKLSAPTEAWLRTLLASHESSTVRWRAAHALGPHPSDENLSTLQRVLEREEGASWVAYGALRAEFEQIWRRSAEERRRLLKRMASDAGDRLVTPGPLRSEAIRCLDVNPLPENWHRDVEPLLSLLWETADAQGAVELVQLAERLRQRKVHAAHVS